MNTYSFIVLEIPLVVSAFLETHKIIQIYIANERKLFVKDIFGIYLKKMIRMLPMYYLFFFGGWLLTPFINSEEQWYLSEYLWHRC
jgi:hypothetical protein